MSSRFLPSLGQLQRASKRLPDPREWPNDECTIPVDEDEEDGYEFSFKKVKFNSRTNGKTCKWVYDGKLMVNTIYCGNENKDQNTKPATSKK